MFTAIVVDNKDPNKSGRLKIRIYGIHDDTSNIPDNLLPWAKCKFPITNPAHNGASGASTGAVVGTIVTGDFLDDDMQLPLIDGVLIKESTANSQSQSTSSSSSSKTDEPDLPKAYSTEDFNKILGDSVFKVGSKDVKFAISKTIGPLKFNGENIQKFLNDIGQGGMANALGSLSSLKNQVSQLASQITNATNLSQIQGLITGAASSLGGNATNVLTTSVGTVFNNVNHLANDITGQTWDDSTLSQVTNVANALNSINVHSFVMNNVMPGIENSFSKIKSALQNV